MFGVTCVPLPLPGGPSNTALMPMESVSAGCSLSCAAAGGILNVFCTFVLLHFNGAVESGSRATYMYVYMQKIKHRYTQHNMQSNKNFPCITTLKLTQTIKIEFDNLK